MIGKLKGRVDEFGEDHVILDVGGVGYLVVCSARTLAGLPGTGEAVALHIETHVREDMIRLYGFASPAERSWFRALMTVQGVGAKVALAILSTLSASELATAIALADRTQIVRAPGVGPKLAQRIATELKDHAPGLAGVDLQPQRGAAAADAPAGSRAAIDAISALVNLGYQPTQASAAIAAAVKAAGDDGAATEELIRRGLRELSK
jgi:Holliday junction DNA helicase RuvA